MSKDQRRARQKYGMSELCEPNSSKTVNKSSTYNGNVKLAELSRSRAWWLITTAIAAALIIGLGALDMIRLLARPIAIFILGVTLAASLAPIVSWLERWMPRLLAMSLVYLLLSGHRASHPQTDQSRSS